MDNKQQEKWKPKCIPLYPSAKWGQRDFGREYRWKCEKEEEEMKKKEEIQRKIKAIEVMNQGNQALLMAAAPKSSPQKRGWVKEMGGFIPDAKPEKMLRSEKYRKEVSEEYQMQQETNMANTSQQEPQNQTQEQEELKRKQEEQKQEESNQRIRALIQQLKQGAAYEHHSSNMKVFNFQEIREEEEMEENGDLYEAQ